VIRRRLLVPILVLALLSVACGSTSNLNPGGSLPTKAQAVTALYATVKSYEFTMGEINRAHAEEILSDAKHNRALTLAVTFQVNAKKAYRLVDAYDPVKFQAQLDALWKIVKSLEALKSGGGN
jgi:hypothetical protein